jgi:hypothetical protein
MDFKLRVVSEEDPNLFKFDIYIKEWREDGMVVHVDFVNPLLVSHGALLDQCRIKVIDPWLFVSKETGMPMPGNARTLIDRFPRQAIAGVDVDAVEKKAKAAAQACGALAGTAVVSLSCCSTLPGALWSGYYVLQLACHLQLFDVYIPASAQIYLDEFTKLVEFEVFNPTTYARYWFGEDFTMYRFVFGGQRTKSALHHSDEQYSIFNDWYFFLCLPLVALVFAFITYILHFCICVKSLRLKVKQMLIDFKTQFFYGLALRFMFMIYLKLLASCGRHLEMFIDQSLFQVNLELYVGIAFLPIIIGLPAHVWLLLEKASRTDGQSKLDKRLGTLCEDLAIRQHSDNMLYWPFFLVRRAFFVGIPTFSSNGGLQVVTLLTSTLAYQAWYESVQPHVGRRRTYLERANEACLFFIFLHIAIFTDWNGDQSGKYLYGYSMGFLFGLIIVINVFFSVTTEIDRQRRNRYLKLQKNKRIIFIREVLEKERLRKIEKRRAVMAKKAKIAQDLLATELRKPKLEKQSEVPMTYGKRVMIKPTGLATVYENDGEDELNESIYRELGCFGDIVEQSRKEILDGYVRPSGKEMKKMKRRASVILGNIPDLIAFETHEGILNSTHSPFTPTQKKTKLGEGRRSRSTMSISALGLGFGLGKKSPVVGPVSSRKVNAFGANDLGGGMEEEKNSFSTD